jgi:epoxyqueuosine reductase
MRENNVMTLARADRAWIEQRASAAGFDLSGIANVSASHTPAAIEQDRRFAAWIDAGRAGEMNYLKRVDEAGDYLRGDLRRAMPWARSVIVCAVNYNADAPRSIDLADPKAGWIARYAWSGRDHSTAGRDHSNSGSNQSTVATDYHDVLLSQLRVLEDELKQHFDSALQTRCYVDTGPLVERGFAARAGVGWVGKNTCVLNQQQGSWLLLGVIITSLELEPDASSLPAADRCGTCTRCIDACPTDALIASPDARQMDASRCIAYLTIEKKGSLPEDLRPLMGRQVFGCDICQDVCPWNRKAPISSATPLPPRRELINPALDWLASMDGPAFNRVFRGSPLERTRRKRILRNVAIAMGNSGDLEFLPQLDSWASGDDPILAESATWAAAHLRATTVAISNSFTTGHTLPE